MCIPSSSSSIYAHPENFSIELARVSQGLPIAPHADSAPHARVQLSCMQMWVPLVHQFRGAIWDKLQDGIINERSSNGSEINWEVILPADTFRIFGWLDDTDMRTNRPRPARTVNGTTNADEIRDTQQAFHK